MSEEQKEEQKKEPLTLEARLHPDGKMEIKCGVWGNPMLTYGFLDMIKQAAIEYHQDQAKPRVQNAA